MKSLRLFTLTALMALLFLTAGAYHSEFTIRLENNRFFELRINNVAYEPESYLLIQNLEPGRYHIEVFELSNTNYGSYHQANRLIRRFSGYIHLPAGYRVNGMINRFGRYVELGRSTLRYELPSPPRPVHNEHYHYGMSHSAYHHLMAILETTSFDNSKLGIARQAVAANGCTAEQVLGIMSQFSFESNRLNFAKFAYRYCVNPEGYFLVTRGFSFESSKRDLMRFIGNRGF